MWLVQRGLGALDDGAPDTLRLLAETIEQLPFGVVLPLQRDHSIDRRVRQLRLTFYFREDAEGPAGSLSAEELPNAYLPRGGPFLARQRVPMGGGAFPTGRDGETLPHWQRVVPPPEFRRSAGSAPAGRVQPTRTPAQALSARLHWPALDEEQFLTAEDLAPGRNIKVLGRTIRILGCDEEHPETRVWLESRGMLLAGVVGGGGDEGGGLGGERHGGVEVLGGGGGGGARGGDRVGIGGAGGGGQGGGGWADPLLPTPDPFTLARAAAMADAERCAHERGQLSAENDELRRRRHIEAAARPALRDAPHQSGRGVPALPSERPRHGQRARLEGVRMSFVLEGKEGREEGTGNPVALAAEAVGIESGYATGGLREASRAAHGTNGAVREAPGAALPAPARHGRGRTSSPAAPSLAPWDRAPDPRAPRNPTAPPPTAPVSLRARRARAGDAETAPRPGELFRGHAKTGAGGGELFIPPVRRRFRLVFFCEDDTISVVEELPLNAGDEFGGRLWARRALPKRLESNRPPGSSMISGFRLRQAGQQTCGTDARVADASNSIVEAEFAISETNFLRPSDLRVGEWVDILGLRMRVVGCDASSRAVAADVYGISMPPDLIQLPSGGDRFGMGGAGDYPVAAGGTGCFGTGGDGMAEGDSRPALRLKPAAVWYDDGHVSIGLSEPRHTIPLGGTAREVDAPTGGCLTFGAVLAAHPPGASGGGGRGGGGGGFSVSGSGAGGGECGCGNGRAFCVGGGSDAVNSLVSGAAGRAALNTDTRRFVITYDITQRHASARALPSAGHTAGWVVRHAPAPPEDSLGLGLPLRLNGHDFVLTSADEASLSFMEARPDRFPAADPRRALAQLRSFVTQSDAARRWLRAALAGAMVRSREEDNTAGGRLSQEHFVEAMSEGEDQATHQATPQHRGGNGRRGGGGSGRMGEVGKLSTHTAVALFRAMASVPAEGGAARLDAPLFLAVATAEA